MKKKNKNSWDKISPTKWAKIDLIKWFPCPHCGQIIINGDPKMVGMLKQWRNQFFGTKKNKT